MKHLLMKHLLKLLACFAAASVLIASCEKQGELADTANLEVSPSDPISFAATGNKAVTLTVTTDAGNWEYTVPEWIEATRTDNTLSVNAKDNTTSAPLAGRIEFTAGDAKPVYITVMQDAGKSGASLYDIASADTDVPCSVEFTAMDAIHDGTLQLKLVLPAPAASEVSVPICYDAEYLAEFKITREDMDDCVLFPESAVKFSSETLTVAAGKKESDPVTVTLDMDAEDVVSSQRYLVPVYVEDENGVEFSEDGTRLNYIVTRKLKKEVKNVVYFEVNDCSPTNAIEYLLEDGTPFFDAVVLFSGNINYDSVNDQVYLSNNSNVNALLRDTDIYLQPLRKKGIKVYLGILGNHDPAGVCQLSDWGAAAFAEEVANAMLQYKLDGVALDDEYSTGPLIGNRWFTEKSGEAGSRLCYELTKAMDEIVPWETEVSVYALKGLTTLFPVDGVQPGEFVDFWVGDYHKSTSPAPGMTMKQCSYVSLQCNLDAGNLDEDIDEDRARQAKAAGYGWIMWFAFDPSGTGTIHSNINGNFPTMQEVSKGLYDIELMKPTGVWDKVGPGAFNPERQPFTKF